MLFLTQTKNLTQQTNLLLRYLDNINWDAVFNHLITVIGEIIFFTILFMVIRSVGKRLITRGFVSYKNRSRLSGTRVDTMRTLTSNIYSYTVLFFYFYAVLSVLGVPVGTLIAGAGVVGIALGLGAQGFVSDVVTGIFIILEGQFDVGDAVKLGAISGTVTSVGLRTTTVKSPDGTVNFIPNRNISIVSNLSRSQMQVLINLPVAPDVDLELLRQTLTAVNHDLLAKTPAITDGPALLGMSANGDGTFAYQVMMHVKNGEQLAVQRKFLGAYLNALAAAGIQIPTPKLRQPQK
ncbi:mechanosensitive ion channel family protein [Lacticaseibacillus baoqingensis]|uniref:Mechanosensitive ion channel family protein n=1 Tax=Lacticaseibacillus baoqingensis TaxID=2486013 RepID=A0ABW4E994_9LACO|nr:mechanosensitive ion channel family protein [Lacticaseibacillus baoqingensis]